MAKARLRFNASLKWHCWLVFIQEVLGYPLLDCQSVVFSSPRWCLRASQWSTISLKTHNYDRTRTWKEIKNYFVAGLRCFYTQSFSFLYNSFISCLVSSFPSITPKMYPIVQTKLSHLSWTNASRTEQTYCRLSSVQLKPNKEPLRKQTCASEMFFTQKRAVLPRMRHLTVEDDINTLHVEFSLCSNAPSHQLLEIQATTALIYFPRTTSCSQKSLDFNL